MSEAVQIEIIRTIPLLLTAFVSYLAYRRVARVDAKVDVVQQATVQLEENTNHKMDIVIEAVKGEAEAKGRESGRADERADEAARQKERE